ncbi:MAG: glycosyltransferase [Bacteroidetes bacterium]|nr:glycosyltransferase [Bacteroidota bacterium]MCL5026737.1 glycosyltransferase [Chloroflexota bacterium]
MADQMVSIVLPVYNQADHIGSVIEEYQEALVRVPVLCECILVVNGSRDNSLSVCSSLAEKYPNVRVVHSERGGWGLAVNLGLRAARGDLLCYTNSARTSAQDLLLLLLYAIANPGTVIKANRKIRESWQRRLGSLMYNIECRTLFDLACWDINGTPKIFPRSFDKLLALTRNDDLIDVEFNVVCQREGYPMLEVPIFSTRRHGGRSTTSYRSALRAYRGAYQLWREIGKTGR